MKIFKKISLIAIAILFIFTGSSCSSGSTTESNHIIKYDEINIANFDNLVETAVEKASQSGVAIVTETWSTASLGSGVIIGKSETKASGTDYYVLTNRHVVDNNGKIAKKLQVFFSGNKNDYVDASVVLYDNNVDCAIVKFNSTKTFVPATIVKEDNLKRGSFVIAYGSPYELEYFGTATFGIVSFDRRPVLDTKYNSHETITNTYIQHDASINAGNSGGGLFDLYGNLVGINTQKLVGESNDVEGIGFSIPIDIIENLPEFSKYFGDVTL